MRGGPRGGGGGGVRRGGPKGPRGGGFGGGGGGFGGGRGGGRGGSSRGGGRGGGGRGGRGGARGGLKAGAKVVVVPFESNSKSFGGVFIVKGKGDSIATRNMVPGISIYGEKRVEVPGPMGPTGEPTEKIEYRLWSPFRSKLGAAIISGISQMPIQPGAKVLYLGAANGTTVSHVSDMVGPEGFVYAVEFSHRSGRDLTDMAKRRPNIIPLVEDARMPWRYRMMVPTVDVIFADVAQPDQSRIVALNAEYFLKEGGFFLISIKASCVDSTASAEAVFASEIDALKKHKCKTREQLSLEPYHRDHALVLGQYKPPKKA